MTQRGFKILLYHSIGTVDPRDDLGIMVDSDKFVRQMELLKADGISVISLKNVVQDMSLGREPAADSVVITFDDGYQDNIDIAAPAMEALGLTATFFITLDYVGSVKTSPKRRWQRWRCMDGDSIRSLKMRGHEIGSHSLDHLDLRSLDRKAKTRQLASSKERLGSIVNGEIELFSYPYGFFDDELIGCLNDCGYQGACTTESGMNYIITSRYELKRTEITSRDTLESFRNKIRT